MTSAFTRTIWKRSARKNLLNKIVGEVETLLSIPKDDDLPTQAKLYLNTVQEKYVAIVELNSTVEDLIDNEENLNMEYEEAYKFKTKIKIMEEKLNKYPVDSENTDPITGVSSNNARSVKVPKIIIKQFDGDLVNWTSFLECFEATVDSKKDLSNVEKFTYLKGFMKEDVLKVIEGLTLTNDNYTQALELLKQRYSNTQLIISTHMNKLIKLEKIHVPNVKALRSLYNNIESNVRALVLVSNKNISDLYLYHLPWKSYQIPFDYK